MQFGSRRKIVGRIHITPMDSLSDLQKRCYRERLESEVATLTYVRLFCSDILTPVVWAWNGSAENAVGSPYVQLDYVEGETLEDVWHNCSGPTEKTTILQEVAKHHAALAKAVLPFRGFGALRFTSVVGEERPLNDTDFRLGPFLSEGRHFQVTKSRQLVSPPPTAALSLSDLWRDLLVEERRSHLICWGAVPETSVVLPKDDTDSSVNVDIAWNDIQTASKLVERLISATRVPPWLCSPCFSISDYAFRNIIYDPACKRLSGYIDWEGVSILPLFMMARGTISRGHRGFAWVPPDGQTCSQESGRSPESCSGDSLYRATFREALYRSDNRFDMSFWEKALALLKIHYLFLHGLNAWFPRTEWLQRIVAEAEQKP
ncbi:hypothetical protein DACRYDRAFT_116203 [Dacryopinax primogenitus]|uniref:Aminoglycoside phosphotransferase domain-containing protein n=1 Tax=Dacryopinax primogenitus (strain DJM 731) TaxID=1858805 RepID=M5G0T1_DACPD|nr:uncharacterized protein DACRYDRAFT_116203 [Dacryopinax primogenitus]EJU01730.1 hypothetical protein DACRYDRAFT_116203 [Dacryopinax primogenitus]